MHYALCIVSYIHGGLAQLGERLLCKQEVNGSIPLISTTGTARFCRAIRLMKYSVESPRNE